MASYRAKFHMHNTHIAGFLVTHADLEDNTDRRESFTATIEQSWKEGIVPILNENDPLCIEELDALKRGGDNDKNALLLAKVFQSKQIIIITSPNGVYTDARDSNSRIEAFQSDQLTSHRIAHLCQ
jgi:glutamate 5-kinase